MGKKIFVLVLFFLALLPLSVAAAGDEDKTKITSFLSKLIGVEQDALSVETIKDSDLIKGAQEASVKIKNYPNTLTVYIVGDKYILKQDAINVESIKDSTVLKGAKEVSMRIGNNPNPFTAFFLGDKTVVGNVFDRNFDPYAENMKKISIKDRPTHGSGPVVLVEYSEFQ
jgi:ribosomal protein S24E